VALALAPSSTALAQQEKKSDDLVGNLFTVEEREADPNKAAVYGYFACFILVGLSLFAVCKSARR
jgi:hypothetical protein